MAGPGPDPPGLAAAARHRSRGGPRKPRRGCRSPPPLQPGRDLGKRRANGSQRDANAIAACAGCTPPCQIGTGHQPFTRLARARQARHTASRPRPALVSRRNPDFRTARIGRSPVRHWASKAEIAQIGQQEGRRSRASAAASGSPAALADGVSFPARHIRGKPKPTSTVQIAVVLDHRSPARDPRGRCRVQNPTASPRAARGTRVPAGGPARGCARRQPRTRSTR